MPVPEISTYYRNFHVYVLPQRGFAGLTWYFYLISGNGLASPVQADMGEQTPTLSLEEAKKWIDKHLVSESEAA